MRGFFRGMEQRLGEKKVRAEKHPVRASTVEKFLKSIVGEDMHAKRRFRPVFCVNRS